MSDGVYGRVVGGLATPPRKILYDGSMPARVGFRLWVGSRPAAATHRRPHHGGPASVRRLPPGTIDFSSSIGPLRMPPRVRSAIKSSVRLAEDYPDPSASKLVSALAARDGLPRSSIVPGNGAVEMIHCVARALLSGRRVLVQAPTFSEYASAARLSGCRVESLTGAKLDVDEFAAKLPRGGCAFLCNPNNPTGAMLTSRQVSRVAREAESRSCILVVDECFIEMSDAPSESVIGTAAKRPNIIVIRSMTKAFGLAGLRLGYAAAPRRMARMLEAARPTWSVNALAQAAGTLAAADEKHLERSRAVIAKERAYIEDGIRDMPGLEVYPSSANFMLLRARRGSRALQSALLARRILVRDCSDFEGLDGHHVRVSVRARPDNEKLLAALEAEA